MNKNDQFVPVGSIEDFGIFCLELGFSQDLRDFQDRMFSNPAHLGNLNKILVQDNPIRVLSVSSVAK